MLAEQEIVKNLKIYYNIEVTNLHFLPLGADMNASVYKVEANSKWYFLKIKVNGYNFTTSSTITQLLYDDGLRQVILPIKTIGGQNYQCIEDVAMVVYPYIDGEDGFKQDLTKEQ